MPLLKVHLPWQRGKYKVDIKILVAAHKKYWMPDDDVYVPLHVGAAGKESLGYLPDNTGDHISSKNPSYCELTGLYWAWKNLDCEYIGLCHYRRYFGKSIHTRNTDKKREAIFHREDYENLLQKYDVLLPKKRNYYIETVRSQYEHAHCRSDLDEAERVVKEMYPSYAEAFSKVMNRKKLHILNMFAMKKNLFDTYCAWLFAILSELEKRIDLTGRSVYEKRAFGFLAERLFNVWLEKQDIKIYEADVVMLEHVDWLKKGWHFLRRKLSGGRW